LKACQDSGKSKQELDNTLEAMNEKFGMKIIIPGKQAEGKKDNIAPG
jgi:hypothetical protein